MRFAHTSNSQVFSFQTVSFPLRRSEVLGLKWEAIQDWLGHSTFNVTANFYSHLDYQSRISSAEVIANALDGEAEAEENEDTNKKTGSRYKNLFSWCR